MAITPKAGFGLSLQVRVRRSDSAKRSLAGSPSLALKVHQQLGQPPGVGAGVEPPISATRSRRPLPDEASEMLRLQADRHAGLRELLDHPQYGIVGFAVDLDFLRLE